MAQSDQAGKTVLVTGASRGIGRAIALAVSRAGYGLAACYHQSEEAALALREAVLASGGEIELLRFDIADRESCRETLERWVKERGAPWGIVCNAGVHADNAFPALRDDEWDRVVHTNLDGLFNVLRPLFMPLARKKRGRIIALASASGITGNRGQVNYSAAKAGIIGAAKALAMELASRSITVNCIAPGVIETDMVNDAPLDALLPQIPLGRIGRAEEVAALAVFLLSEDAAYITRQVISVNGGLV